MCNKCLYIAVTEPLWRKKYFHLKTVAWCGVRIDLIMGSKKDWSTWSSAKFIHHRSTMSTTARHYLAAGGSVIASVSEGYKTSQDRIYVHFDNATTESNIRRAPTSIFIPNCKTLVTDLVFNCRRCNQAKAVPYLNKNIKFAHLICGSICSISGSISIDLVL